MPRTAKHWDSKRYAVYRNQFMKTQLCKYYGVGSCTKGAECNFAHGLEEMSIVPDLKKTALCEDFKHGRCSLPKEQCQYAHGQDDLRSSLAFQSIRKASQPDSDQAAASEKAVSSLSPSGGQEKRKESSPKKSAKTSVKTKPPARSSTKFSDRGDGTASTCSNGSGKSSLTTLSSLQQSRTSSAQHLEMEQEALHAALQQLQRVRLQQLQESQLQQSRTSAYLQQSHLQQAMLSSVMAQQAMSAAGPSPPMQLADPAKVFPEFAANLELLTSLRANQLLHHMSCQGQNPIAPAEASFNSRHSTLNGLDDVMHVSWSELDCMPQPGVWRL
mmetsp:Transcript_105310/g.187184  ORF Transcript_105310/g.187184 Transcript_105310/m.187184 type:complete len:329 (-) Transcript_105310:219-1205(-)